MKFTAKTIAQTKLPDGKPSIIYWDDDVRGFGLRLQGDAETWVVRYRPSGTGKQVQKTLGPVLAIPIRQARTLASDYILAARQGRDLAQESKAKAAHAANAAKTAELGRVGSIIEGYLARKKSELSNSTFRMYRTMLLDHWAPFHDRQATASTLREYGDHLEWLKEKRGPASANYARAALMRAFAWAVTRGMIKYNPMVGTTNVARKVERDRILTFKELTAIWNAAADMGDYGKIVRLALYTGQRRGELGGMAWPELDLHHSLWTIPAARLKNGKEHRVPLSRQAVILIESMPKRLGWDCLFGVSKNGLAGWSKPKRDLDRLSGSDQWAEGWRFHDLRRSFVSHMVEMGGVPWDLVEVIVNHQGGHRSGVAGVYNRSERLEERTKALQQWANYLDACLKGEAKVIIPIHRPSHARAQFITTSYGSR